MDFQEFSGKTVDDALTNASVALGTASDELEYEIVERGSTGFLGIGNKDAVIKARKKSLNPEDVARDFVQSILDCMQVDADISISRDEEDALCMDLSGEAMGIMIGKRGQTLDALQYLTSLVANKHSEDYVRIKLDTESYRDRRKKTLENLAKNIAFKVKRTKKPVRLEPMNPFERRVIHYALQNDRYVTTYSEGDEPFRRVVVVLKK